jgi:hypothetical protein
MTKKKEEKETEVPFNFDLENIKKALASEKIDVPHFESEEDKIKY